MFDSQFIDHIILNILGLTCADSENPQSPIQSQADNKKTYTINM